MRVILVIEIAVADSDNVSRVVGAIRESVERLTEDVNGVSMTAHVGDAADRIAAVVDAEMGEH